MTHPEDLTPIKEGIDQYTEHLTHEVIEGFWPERPIYPELNGNGVMKEDLARRVMEDMMLHLGRTRENVFSVLTGAQDPERAFEDMQHMLRSTALVAATRNYEALVMEKKAGIDDMTGLPNKKVYKQNLHLAIENNKRFGQNFSLIFFDLDRFKRVNDDHGHTAGDMVLIEMARRLSQDAKLRDVDSLARYGGEEFVAILPGTPKEGAAILAQRISEQITKAPFKVVDNEGCELELDVTASIGIAQYSEYDDDPDGAKMVASADSSLYVLKGEAPDAEGLTEDRRGQIACERRILTPSEIEEYRVRMQRSGRRTSLPPKKH